MFEFLHPTLQTWCFWVCMTTFDCILNGYQIKNCIYLKRRAQELTSKKMRVEKYCLAPERDAVH